MKIDLGQHGTANRTVITAWIEPNRPALRGGKVRDNGFLCITGPDSLYLHLENTSEDAQRLMDAVGSQLGQQLWEERKRYDREPYYMTYNHATFGQLYFTPRPNESQAPSVYFDTRPDGYPSKKGGARPEGMSLDQLKALFASEHLARHGEVVPSAAQIGEAIKHAQQVTEAITSRYAEYSSLVYWDFDKRLKDVMMAATGHAPFERRAEEAPKKCSHVDIELDFVEPPSTQQDEGHDLAH
jgi:hypothetical protein